MIWTPAVAAVAACVFGRLRDARLPGVLWAGAVVLLVTCSDNLSGAKVGSVYLLVNLVAVALAVRSLVWWAKLRRSVEVHHLAAIVCVITEAVGLLIYKLGPTAATWDFARAANVLAFTGLLLIEGAVLWSNTSTSSR